MTTKHTKKKAAIRRQDKADLFQVVTDKIIATLEKGTPPWRKPWKTVAGGHTTGMSGLPANAVTGRTYSGINVLLLWIDAADKGFTSHRWLTFKQALDVGGNVRKGEKSTLVTLFKPFEKKEMDEQGKPLFDEQGNAVVSQRNFMTSFHLFNVEQCENLPDKLLAPVTVAGDAEETPEQDDIERIQRAAQVVTCSGVPVVHRQTARYHHRYEVFRDFVQMAARAVHNQVVFSQPLEDEYLSLVKQYERDDVNRMGKLLGILRCGLGLQQPIYDDVLGRIFMNLELGDAHRGQFFTPFHISRMMAMLSVNDLESRLKQAPFLTVGEPAWGFEGQ